MPNQVILRDDDIILQVLNKNMVAEDLKNALPLLLEYGNVLRKQQKPMLVLIDALAIRTTDSATRKQGVANLDQMNYQRIAIFGAGPYLHYLINFVLLATGKSRIKMFPNEAQALDWLKKENL